MELGFCFHLICDRRLVLIRIRMKALVGTWDDEDGEGGVVSEIRAGRTTLSSEWSPKVEFQLCTTVNLYGKRR